MIAAIDIGGTKTKVLASDNHGNIFFENVVKGFGLAVDNENELIDELKQCIQKIPSYKEIKHIVVNLGGKNCKQIKSTLKNVCPDANIDIFRESTGIIGDIIRKKANADVILFAGTGSIALGYGENGYFISDGWGRDIGDMGSGYFIGLETIKACLAAIVGQQITPLITHITGMTEAFSCIQSPDELVEKRDAVRSKILPLDRDKTAAYTRIAAEYAKKVDPIAISVFESAGKALADTAIRVCKKIGKFNTITIAVCGGVANSKEFWEASFREQFSQFANSFDLVFPETDFAKGALLYALQNNIYEERN